MSTRSRLCRCPRPDRSVDRDGVAYCDACGELMHDGKDELIAALVRKVDALAKASKAPPAPPSPRLSLTRAEAAEAMGMSVDSFERYVQPDVGLVRRGKLRLVPVRELESWLARNAEGPMAESLGSSNGQRAPGSGALMPITSTGGSPTRPGEAGLSRPAPSDAPPRLDSFRGRPGRGSTSTRRQEAEK